MFFTASTESEESNYTCLRKGALYIPPPHSKTQPPRKLFRREIVCALEFLKYLYRINGWEPSGSVVIRGSLVTIFIAPLRERGFYLKLAGEIEEEVGDKSWAMCSCV